MTIFFFQSKHDVSMKTKSSLCGVPVDFNLMIIGTIYVTLFGGGAKSKMIVALPDCHTFVPLPFLCITNTGK